MAEQKRQEMSTDEIIQYLEKKKISAKYLSILKKSGIDESCLDSMNIADLTSEGIPSMPAKAILKRCRELSESLTQQRHKREEKVVQEPRRFRREVGDLHYVYRATFPFPEASSNSLLLRTQEYKEMARFDRGAAFMKQFKKFVIGCINARQDATIYFGVADGQKGQGQYQHGEITGVSLARSERKVIYDVLDGNLFGREPSMFPKGQGMQSLVQDCLQVHIVPVEGAPDERVVIEIDVFPRYDVCKSKMAYFYEGKSRKAFIRKGTQTCEINDKEWRKYEGRISKIARKRKNVELQCRQHSSGSYEQLEMKLKHSILRGYENIEDREFQYVLVTDHFNKQTVGEKDFSWLASVRWNFVIDLDPSESNFQRAKDGHDRLRLITLNEMKEALREGDLLQRIGFHEKSPWIVARTEGLSSEEWLKEAKGTVSKAISTLTSGAAQEDKDSIVVLFLINDERFERELSLIFNELIGCVALSSLVCLSSKEHVLQQLGERICITKEDWKSAAICCESWPFFSSFMECKLKKQITTGYKITCSSGQSGVDISTDLVNEFRAKHIELLLMNQCALIDQEAPIQESRNEISEAFKDFYRGAEASWELFYHSFDQSSSMKGSLAYPGIVYRPRVDGLVDDLGAFMSSEQEVSVMHLIHHPDAGATTLAMHALWNLRKKMRCVKINCQDLAHSQQVQYVPKSSITSLAENLNKFRLFKEMDTMDVTKIRPVLVLLDRASFDLADQLKKELKQVLAGQPQSNCKFIILACQQSRSSKKKSFREVGMDKHIYLQQQLDGDVEENLFKKKLEELEMITADCPLDTLLAFVIMANNFNSKSEKVVKFVERAIEGIEKFPDDMRLLLYLSIIKYYGNMKCVGLPTKHCKLLLKNRCSPHEATRSIRNAVCTKVDICLVERELNLQLNQHPLFVEVSHTIVAELLVKKLIPLVGNNSTLSSITSDLFEHKAFMREKFLQWQVHSTLRYLLIWRGFKDMPEGTDLFLDDEDQVQHSGGVPEMKKERFSKIISEIYALKPDDAIQLLEKAHDVLIEDWKANLSQAIARLYLDGRHFEKSRDWGLTAVNEANGIKVFPYHDTLGQIDKKEMASIISSIKDAKEPYNLDDIGLKQALCRADDADGHFQLAQKDYNTCSLREDRNEMFDQRGVPHTGGDAPGIMGRVQIRQEIFKLLTQSQEFKASGEAVKQFRLMLQQHPNHQDISQLRELFSHNKQAFESFELQWQEKRSFIGSIYHETKKLLAAAAKKMTEIRMDILEREANAFQATFGTNVMHEQATSIVEQNDIEEMIRFLDPLYIRNFSWTIERNLATLKTFVYMLKAIEKLLKDPQAEDMHQFRLCYVTCFLALFDLKEYAINLEQATLYCEQMISSMDRMIEFQYQEWPEICNFYILLCMINSSKEWWTEERKQMWGRCLELLHRQYKSHRMFRDKIATYFYAHSIDQESGRVRLSRKENVVDASWILGRTDIKGRLHFQLFPGMTITLEREHVIWRGNKSRKNQDMSIGDVRFRLQFTQISPIAKQVMKNDLVKT